MADYMIESNKLITKDFEVSFDFCIKDVQFIDNIYVLLLDIPNDVDETDNIYGVNEQGKIIWRIENPIEAFNINKDEQGYRYLASSTYVNMHLSPNGVFTANTFFAIKYTLDYKTGKLLKIDFNRW